MPSFKRPIGASGLLAFALVVAACGSGGDTQTAGSGAAAEEPTAAATPSTDEATAESDGSATADSADEAAVEPGADAEPQTETETEGEAEAEGPQADEHVFPDLETVNIVDGSTINLADQLAGGDTPILLWFFAPH